MSTQIIRDSKGKFIKGYKHSDEWKETKRRAMSGNNNPCKRPEVKEKLRVMFSGVNSHFWKGGVSNENHRIRQSLEYRIWRESVFKRDDYTCQECGKRGVELQADHVKPFAYHPKLRFDINNGRTLCIDCHRLTDTYAINLKKV